MRDLDLEPENEEYKALEATANLAQDPDGAAIDRARPMRATLHLRPSRSPHRQSRRRQPRLSGTQNQKRHSERCAKFLPAIILLAGIVGMAVCLTGSSLMMPTGYTRDVREAGENLGEDTKRFIDRHVADSTLPGPSPVQTRQHKQDEACGENAFHVGPPSGFTEANRGFRRSMLEQPG
jgi:hypothetical protein